jgi:hypothetical protein
MKKKDKETLVLIGTFFVIISVIGYIQFTLVESLSEEELEYLEESELFDTPNLTGLAILVIVCLIVCSILVDPFWRNHKL